MKAFACSLSLLDDVGGDGWWWLGAWRAPSDVSHSNSFQSLLSFYLLRTGSLESFPFESLVLCGVFWECYSQKLSIWEKPLEVCFLNLLFSRYFLLSSISPLCWCFVWWSLYHLSSFLLVFSVWPFLSVCTTNCHTSFRVSFHLQCVKGALTHSVCLLCVHSVFLAIAFCLSLSVVVGGFLFFIFRAGGGAPHLFVALSTSMVLQPPCLKPSSSPQQFWEDHWLASWLNWKNCHVNFDESGIYFRPWACTTTSSSLFWEVEKFRVQECAPALCNCCRIWESAFILGSYRVALCFVLLYPSSSLLFGDENLWPNLRGAKQSHSCNGLLVDMSAGASTWLMIVVQRVEQL